jgi:hypothetical protein
MGAEIMEANSSHQNITNKEDEDIFEHNDTRKEEFLTLSFDHKGT